MKFLSYNIFLGGKEADPECISFIKDYVSERTDLIMETIKEVNPDLLTIQEANYFEKNDYELTRLYSETLGMPYYSLAKGKRQINGSAHNVVTFSKVPIKKSQIIPLHSNACLETILETKIGEIGVFNTHLAPYSEDQRLAEARTIMEQAKKFDSYLVMGDMNSLSHTDSYDEAFHQSLNGRQRRKFIKNDRIENSVMRFFQSEGAIDIAQNKEKNHIRTVPTASNKDPNHGSEMRLDYMLCSHKLLPYIEDYQVLKTEISNLGSDHYPVVITVSDKLFT